QTPSGVAAVKGTEFIVRSDAQGTTVITLDGVVEFFNNAGTVDVTAGNIVTVAPGQAPPPPRRATSEELAGFQALIEDESGTAETDRVQVEITVQDAEGRSRTLIMELPRAEVRAILGGGR
ncbi:MAG TPA: hypothetical protein VMM35_10275, partial [Longimicrobiales bacterium]|nr:hypothetical protein [Longimicrobiales bacterium]